MKTIMTTMAALFALALFSLTPANAQSACKGLSQSACGSNNSCSFVKGFKRKDGANVKAFCRAKPGGGAKKSVKKSTSKTKKATAKASDAKSASKPKKVSAKATDAKSTKSASKPKNSKATTTTVKKKPKKKTTRKTAGKSKTGASSRKSTTSKKAKKPKKKKKTAASS